MKDTRHRRTNSIQTHSYERSRKIKYIWKENGLAVDQGWDGKNEQARACTKKFSGTKDITENWTVTVLQLYIFA